MITIIASLAGAWSNRRLERHSERWGHLTEAQIGYVVTTVYTLLGLLVGFTFSIAMDRYQQRRELVVQDASAIEQLYLRAQLLDEPHRSRISDTAVRLAENHVRLAAARHDDSHAARLISEDRLLLRDLWMDAVPAYQSIRTLEFSSSFVDSVNKVITIDAERKAARQAQIPRSIILLLIFYSIVAAVLLGAVMNSRKGEWISIGLIGLSTLALMLVTDINRPVEGTIREPDEPMLQMLERLKEGPPATYQKLATATPR